MRVKLKRNITIHKLENKLTLFDGERSILYNFNKSAEFILNSLKLGFDKRQIIGNLKKKYGASAIEAEEDYKYILDFLKEKNIIQEK